MTPSLRWTSLPASALVTQLHLRRQWDHLNACRLDLPFLGSNAVTAALEVFGTGSERLFVAHAAGPEEPVAMFLCMPAGPCRWSTFQPSQLPLGAWVAAPEWTLATLARSLMHSGRLGRIGPGLVLSVTQVDPTMQTREADTGVTLHDDFVETAWLDVAGSFADYWAARGKNLRQNMRKQRNKLAADGIVAEMRLLREPGDVAGAIARYGDMESRGWKAGQGTAIHPDNDQGRFYARLFDGAARRGEMLMFEYLFNGRTVAMDMGLVRNGVLVVLKTTYDESVPKALSPAALLREEALHHLFDEARLKRIEYYGRVMEWHTKLTDNKRMLYHLTCYRWPVVKRLALRRRAAATPAAAAVPAAAEPAAEAA